MALRPQAQGGFNSPELKVSKNLKDSKIQGSAGIKLKDSPS